MEDNEDLTIESKLRSSMLSEHGAVRRMYSNFGIAKAFLRRYSAECAGRNDNFSVIICSCSFFEARARSIPDL
jgi:hypothetical protein